MKKIKNKFIKLILGLILLFSLSSCEVYTCATTQDDIYVETQTDIVYSNIDFNVIITYGHPYYHNGSILYYLYNDLYYYPFYYNNYWYVRAYRRPFTHFNYRPYFRPHRYDYKFKPGIYKGYNKPIIKHYNNRHIGQIHQQRQNNVFTRKNSDYSIPQSRGSIQHQNSRNHGNFGGSRHK